MKRGGPLERRTPLKRTRLRRRSKTMEARMVAWSEIREETFRRDRWTCQAPRHGLDPRGCVAGIHAHHVLRRSQGGEDAVWNLVTLCVVHHQYVHDHPEWSRSVGLLDSAPPLSPGTLPG